MTPTYIINSFNYKKSDNMPRHFPSMKDGLSVSGQVHIHPMLTPVKSGTHSSHAYPRQVRYTFIPCLPPSSQVHIHPMLTPVKSGTHSSHAYPRQVRYTFIPCLPPSSQVHIHPMLIPVKSGHFLYFKIPVSCVRNNKSLLQLPSAESSSAPAVASDS